MNYEQIDMFQSIKANDGKPSSPDDGGSELHVYGF